MLPERLADVGVGEAVLVEFGRGRQALGVVLGPAVGALTGEAKPILARVRADGPLLPPLSLAFARWISEEYLAPPAAVLRSMLPPGMLERLDLVAERLPIPRGPLAGAALGAVAVDRAEADLLERLDAGPRAVRDLDGEDGRAATLRRLRAMASRGLVRLEWTLAAATSGPRYERWLTLTDEGRGVAGAGAAGAASGAAGAGGVAGGAASRLGPRQRGLLADLDREWCGRVLAAALPVEEPVAG